MLAEVVTSSPRSRRAPARWASARALPPRGHVGELELHALELAQRLTELLALVAVRHRMLERPPRDAHRLHRDPQPAGVEALHRVPEPRPARPRPPRATPPPAPATPSRPAPSPSIASPTPAPSSPTSRSAGRRTSSSASPTVLEARRPIFSSGFPGR